MTTASDLHAGDRIVLTTAIGSHATYRVETTRAEDPCAAPWDCFTVLTREWDGAIARRDFRADTPIVRA